MSPILSCSIYLLFPGRSYIIWLLRKSRSDHSLIRKHTHVELCYPYHHYYYNYCYDHHHRYYHQYHNYHHYSTTAITTVPIIFIFTDVSFSFLLSLQLMLCPTLLPLLTMKLRTYWQCNKHQYECSISLNFSFFLD